MRDRATSVATSVAATAFAVAATLALVLGSAGAVGLTLAPAAGAAVWTVSSGAKVFPDTRPGAVHAIGLSAARNEYEAAQVALSGDARRRVTLSWDPSSDPLLPASADLFQVGYVRVRRSSTNAHARPGLYPDPLLPAAFGTPVTVKAGTTSFYVRLHVPLDATAGVYRGTLVIDDPGQGPGPTAVPVTLQVRDFGWDRVTLNTALPFSIKAVKASMRGALTVTPRLEAQLADVYSQFFADHDIDPTYLYPAPGVDPATGHILPLGSATRLSPYMGVRPVSPGTFSATALPLWDHEPWPRLDPAAVRGPLSTYLDELFDVYVANGWQDAGYVYVYDEPDRKAEHETETLARIVHEVSARHGFRAKVLSTDWPRPTASGGRAANRFLFDDVDIWCPSVYTFFDSQPELLRRREAGAETWWYTYARTDPTRYPTFLIDESLAEERCVPWLTWRWNASGFLYWGTTRWGDPVTGDGYRDPYTDTVSYASMAGWIANGEACLVYPGYEPSRGLTDPLAGPVSSLRLESLRDGIEDYEYLRLATTAGRLGAPAGYLIRDAARAVSASVCDYGYGACSTYVNVPRFSKDAGDYGAAREHLATLIERAQAGQGPVTVAGTVVSGPSAVPVAGATVTDGVVATTTAADGSFRLAGVLGDWHLTVRHPLFRTARVAGAGDLNDLQVACARDPRALLLAGFGSRAGFRVAGRGRSVLQGERITSGRRGVRLSLRSGAAATLSLPRRDLRRRRTLGLDVFSADGLDHRAPWFVRLSVGDRAGHTCARLFVLRPAGWTHLTLPLRGRGLNLRRLKTVRVEVTKGRHTLYADTLVAR